MKKLLWVGLVCLSLVGCAKQVPLNKITQSGKPEGEYPNYSTDKVIDVIVQRCNEKGMIIEDQSKNYVVCSRQMDGGSAIMAQMLIGNSYSTTPQAKVRYTVSKFKTGSKIWVDAWIETQMAFGQIQRAPINDNQTINGFQKVLDEDIPRMLRLN